jgi:hypothetical protein
MEPQISDETLAYVDEFFRQRPELIWKLSAFQEAVKQAEQRGLQKALIHQLRLKFTSIPDSVVQKIEATGDIEQLDTWFEQVFAAKSLADTGLLDSEPKQ